MPSNKQIFNFVLCATIASAWPAAGQFDAGTARAQKPSRSVLITEKLSPAKVKEEEEEEASNRPGRPKQVRVFVHEGDTVVMHSGTQEVKIEESKLVAIKGKTYFIVTGDVNFGYPGQEERGLVAASSVHAEGSNVLTLAREGSFEIEGTTVRVDFDQGSDVSVCDARQANVTEGSSLIALNCEYVSAREGAKLDATGCKHVDVRDCSKATVKNCRSVEFFTNASGTASGCHMVTVRDSSAECDNCETVKVWGKGKITASNCAEVDTWGDSEIVVKDAKSIEAWGSSKVLYTGSPKIRAFGPATFSKM